MRGKALGDQESFGNISDAINGFLSRRFTDIRALGGRNAKISQLCSRFEGQDFHSHLVRIMTRVKNEQGSQAKSSKSSWPVVPQILKVRDTVEDMALGGDPSLKARLSALYGPGFFKCPEIHRKFFYEGFTTASDRDTHRDKHKCAFFCTYPGCPSALIGFINSMELSKHNSDYHEAVAEENEFPWNGSPASIDIVKEIRNGNLPMVEAWADQWETCIPIGRLWFSTGFDNFSKSPLGYQLRKGENIRNALGSGPGRTPSTTRSEAAEQRIKCRFSSIRCKPTLSRDHEKQKGNNRFNIYEEAEEIDSPLFEAALTLNFEGKKKMISLLLLHANIEGRPGLRIHSGLYLESVKRYSKEAFAWYLLIDLGLLQELNDKSRTTLVVTVQKRLPDISLAITEYGNEKTWVTESAKRMIMSRLAFEFGESLTDILPATKADLWINGTRLHEYCTTSDVVGAANLIKTGRVELNLPDAHGFTPLHLAATKQDLEMAALLAGEPGVILDEPHSHSGLSALHHAIRANSSRTVEIVLNAAIPIEEISREVSIDNTKTTALRYSSKSGYWYIWQRLKDYLDANTDWSLYPQDSTALIRFCATGNLFTVRNALRRAPHNLNVSDSRGGGGERGGRLHSCKLSKVDGMILSCFCWTRAAISKLSKVRIDFLHSCSQSGTRTCAWFKSCSQKLVWTHHTRTAKQKQLSNTLIRSAPTQIRSETASRMQLTWNRYFKT